MKTPITYYGGKQALLKHLLPLVPPHKIYCEPYFGGGALFFAKAPADVEIINDLNSEVVNFFKVAKTRFAELEKEIKGSLHSRELYKKAMVVYSNPDMFDEVKRAWAFWVATNQGFSSLIGSWGFGKTNSKEKAVAHKRDCFSCEFSERLKGVQIENNDALKIIARADSKDTFIYVDPPYVGSDQGHYKGFNEQHLDELLKTLSSVKGKFLLSSYPSPLLNKYIRKNKWRVQRLDRPVAVTKLTDKMKTELMIMNYDPATVTSGLIQSLKKLKIAA